MSTAQSQIMTHVKDDMTANISGLSMTLAPPTIDISDSPHPVSTDMLAPRKSKK
ncbi:MAG: hypothetical protein L6R40_006308 [Gallowayella cf. fulva]|nr:MAG: hypothetical protein L6R40_006308 [Xanthomendoza cf. fulva]